ncbi:MAG: Asp-tRNA(Asn)/Glu-tRNA(Gln) amidotransferase subunit GatC [Candidatus Bathyarchaeia archaeon]
MGERITPEDLERLCWLSRLRLSQEEKEAFLSQLNKVLEYFKKIDEIDVEGVPPTHHVVDLTSVLREDEVEEPRPDEILELAPRRRGRYILAPRII